jgi:hypothetical protein
VESVGLEAVTFENVPTVMQNSRPVGFRVVHDLAG